MCHGISPAMAVLAVASSSAKPAMKYRRQWIQRIDEHIGTTVKRVSPHLRADKSAEGVKTLTHIGRLRPEPVSDVCLRRDLPTGFDYLLFRYFQYAFHLSDSLRFGAKVRKRFRLCYMCWAGCFRNSVMELPREIVS